VIVARTKSADETRALAGELAPIVRTGDVILLAGDLGAGKTVFVQGLAQALGVRERVTSPTFVLSRQYEGDLPVVHIDVYRLDHVQEVIDIGLAELVDDDAVVLIEWGDVVAQSVGPNYLGVRLEYPAATADGPVDDRVITLSPRGEGWAPRQQALRRAVGRWVEEG
jgi:tRNA threonylcarbamoyladenosine biosynthesis protein TsaE